MNSDNMTVMKMLVEDIRLTSGISRPQAEHALQTTLRFLGSRLPSPVMGRIREALSESGRAAGVENAGNQS
jgi:hypothetical protein